MAAVSEHQKTDPEFRESVQQVCDVMLASLPRRDQRKWGSRYISGLLGTNGRKTMRRIAADKDGSAVEQSLQQFISKSPWDWRPVRQALAQYMEQKIHPLAWVVNPLVIPKVGNHSVGVERRFVRQLGRLTNCQSAKGIWLAGDQGSCPIDWQLVLPPRWLADTRLRERAEIPQEADDSEMIVVQALLDIISDWGIRRRPVVLSESCPDGIEELAWRGIPFIAPVGESFNVISADQPVRGPGQTMTASQVLNGVQRLWRPVELFDPRSGAERVALGVLDRVRLPYSAPVREHVSSPSSPMVLFGVRNRRERSGRHLWLSNITDLNLEALIHLASLPHRVEMDQENISRMVGIMDFEGRTYRGWHHHVTLVSVAHAIRLMSEMSEDGMSDFRAKGWLHRWPLTVYQGTD